MNPSQNDSDSNFEVMDTDQKPSASKLYQTIRAINEAKAQMVERAKQMFNAVAEQQREMSTVSFSLVK